MSEPQPDIAVLQEAVEALRRGGGARVDPVRFAYLQGLARRVGGQPEAVQQVLLNKLQAALAEYGDRAERAAPIQCELRTSRRNDAIRCAPLAQLNEHIRAAAAARDAGTGVDEPRTPDELASVRRFRQAWSAARTLDEVQRALARKPAQAGPLNSHALVLHSLALMRSLSPDYLRRFLSYAESLQWLQHVREQLPKPRAKTAKPARRPRRKT